METQVPTMRNENSGISPKLRTYGPIRGYTMQRATYANGGMTLDLASPTMDVAKHKTGYYVAGFGKLYSFPLVSDVRPYREALGAAYAYNPNGLVGTWLSDGTVYAQATEHYSSHFVARMVARKLGQTHIYDCEAGTSIPVDPPVLKVKL